MEFGVFTFGDVPIKPGGLDAAQRIQHLIEEITLADEVGLDVFGLGEHHREGYAVTSPPVVLAAAAAHTEHIRLTSSVTVLSSDDPLRVFEQFTALDLVSSGRAEIMAGRGAFADSFRLFGVPTTDHDSLFEEKLKLLALLRDQPRVTWAGRFRPPLEAETLLPRPVQSKLPIWVAVGGTLSSAERAGRLALPMAFVMLGGHAQHFTPLLNAYRSALTSHGHAAQPISLNLHGFLSDTSQRAADIYYPADNEVMNRVYLERGMRPTGRAEFDAKVSTEGVYAVGSPAQVADKILRLHGVFGHQRTMLQLAVGLVEHRDVMHAIELLGTQVAPAVREQLDHARSHPTVHVR